jgi:flavodoxin
LRAEDVPFANRTPYQALRAKRVHECADTRIDVGRACECRPAEGAVLEPFQPLARSLQQIAPLVPCQAYRSAFQASKVNPLKRHALVLCKSVHHGNTELVANRIATVLGAMVVDPEYAMLPSAGALGLIGIGSGIYFGRFHKSVRVWLKSLPANAGEGHRVFVYSTSGLPFLSCIYHRPLRRGLEKKGFEVVAEFSCRGYDTWGLMYLIGGLNRKHPDEHDLLRAERFAEQLSHTLS